MHPEGSAQARLIAAAEAELIAGAGQIEMQAVAKRAGVSVGLAYHHFGSKAGLIAAVVSRFYAQLEETVFARADWPANTWAERERGRIAAYVRFHYQHPLAQVVIGVLSRAVEVVAVETAFTRRQLDGGAQMIARAQRDGVIDGDLDPKLTIALMIGGIRQASISALMQEPRPDAQELTDDIWSFMAGALGLAAK